MGRLAEVTQRVTDVLPRVEERLGIERGLFAGLRAEPNDWLFVIKSQAILDAALARALALRLQQPGVRALLDEAGGPANARLARAVGLLGPADEARLQQLTALHAAFGHEVSQVSTASLGDHGDAWAAARQAAFLRQAMGWPDALCEPLGRSSAPLLWFGGLLKLMCWMAGAFVLVALHDALQAVEDQALTREPAPGSRGAAAGRASELASALAEAMAELTQPVVPPGKLTLKPI